MQDKTLPIVRVDFVAGDVLSVRSDIGDVSDAEDFLHENRKYIGHRSTLVHEGAET